MQKITKDFKEQLTTNVEYYSKLKAEITRLSLQLKEISNKINGYHKLERGSLKLDKLLKSQRSPNIKFDLGFEEGQTSKDANEKLEIKEEKKPINQEKSSYARQINTTRNERYMDNDGFTHIMHQRRRRFLTPTTTWQSPQLRFTQSFSGYYFKYNRYGHRISECKYNIGTKNFSSRNIFSPFIDYAIECYNYHNYDHIARNWRSTLFSNQF